MQSKSLMFLSCTAAAFASAPAAMAQHGGDVGLALIGDRITTGAYDLGVFSPGQRVFGAEFGELFPDFTDEPGFDSLPGTFPVPSAITFNIRSALRLWEGDHFGTIIPAERLQIGFGPITPVLTPLTDVLTPGFGIAVGSNGEWHRHLEYTLQSPAAEGIYLLEMSLVGNHSSMGESLPFWIVFNQNMPETEHDEAIEWANNNLVPAPGAGGVLLAAGALLSRRRRHRVGSRD